MKPLSSVLMGRGRFGACLLLGALALLALAAPAFAAQSLTGTYTGRIIGREVTFTRNGKSVTDWAGTLKLALDGGGGTVPVFCIEIDVLVRDGDRYRSDGPIQQLPNGCEIRYLLNKYPASTAKTADEAAARQLAIWVFSDGIDPTTIVDKPPGLRDRVLALVHEAQNAPCPPTRAVVPELTLEPPVANAAAGDTVNYTVRVAPPGFAKSVHVAISGPATLVDGRQQASIPLDAQGAATFGVVGAAAGESTIDASLPFQLDAGLVFSHLDDNHKTQRLVMADKHNFTAKVTAQAHWAGGAPQPSPTAAPPTPTVAAPDTPQPTKPPKRRRTPTEVLPTSTEVPPTPEAQPTAEALPTTVAAEQPSPVPEAAAPEAAGGASPANAGPRPRRLPTTGAPAGGMAWAGLGLAALLLVGGVLIRRRASRR
jgi:LPXTG-motif cell wall-anchored protein